MYHPKGTIRGGGGDVAAGSAGFGKLLQALADQYESDLANAQRQNKADHNLAVELPTSPVLVESVPETSIAFTVPNSMKDIAVPQNAWLEEPTTPSSLTITSEKPPGRPLREQAAVTLDSSQLLRASRSSEQLYGMKQHKLKKDTLPDTAVSKFVRSSTFDRLSAALLVGNAIFIGFQVELSFRPEVPVAVEAVDYAFCLCFILELTIRIYGFGCRHFWCNKEDRAWNCFDFIIVSLSTVDAAISLFTSGAESPLGNVSILRVVRIVRITRVLRIIRVMKFFQDLRILVAAIGGTLKTASFALMLIIFMMYMFGIAVTQMVAEHVKDQAAAGVASDPDLFFFFGSIFRTIFCMFMTISGGIDWKDAAVPLMEVGAMALVFYLLYVALMVLCVMNVLTGMFCQSAIDTAASDRENVIQMQLNEKHRFVETLQTMFDKMDHAGDGRLRTSAFQEHLAKDEMQALLRSLEIEVRDAITLFELLDTDGSGEIDIEEFVTGCITLRGGAKAVHMEKVSNMNKIFNARFDQLDKKLDDLSDKVKVSRTRYNCG